MKNKLKKTIQKTTFRFDLTELAARPEGVLAIDPGLSGAAVFLHKGILYAKRNFKKLPDIVTGIREILGDTLSLPCKRILIEQVHAMPHQGVCSMFSFGEAYGVAQGIIWACCGTPLEYVTPQKWQNHYRAVLQMGREEEFDSRAIAETLFFGQPELFKWKKDHNTADAALMALYGLATLAYGA